ncbi:GAF domain-like protein [Punctularia strigosozonata HHB-11173 SS5]|uniref:GAF domain-like protein n=1 Tax=Punctularia strigosozonata (strain HHB-11173) TaxID=741275 RepID=UPI00044184E8|nr:GAF domain-like protein [Punctularia strigosozonata HHB-11173 SS5]EIN11533.1 GAF domain-like protein [Punctularia strigosozonata HHB-11173 SS5]
MPHADSALVPPHIQSKADFWSHVHLQLSALLEGQRNWVTNLSNAASLIYASLLAFPLHFGADERAVNWCGFYLISTLFPTPLFTATSERTNTPKQLLLAPFCGKPACQFIQVSPPERARGVCATAYVQRRTVLVPDVEAFPGHIACDGETKSEIVVPLILKRDGEEDVNLGVLDLDCLALAGFTEEDQVGLERIAQMLVAACDW